MIKVGIIGSTGYAGQQLFWLLKNHKEVEITFLSSHNHTNMTFDQVYSNYYGFTDTICIDMQTAIEMLPLINVLFIALPHGYSFDITKKALELGVKVIDLGADYRLKDFRIYKKWYKVDHKCSDLLELAVYGLPELYKKRIKNSNLIANPGCYPTASILALAPLLKLRLINPDSIIIDAKSGISGSGRKANMDTLFTECNESVKAYNIASHRHTPEIEQELSNIGGENITLSFTPHLIPMNRGILVTCYAKLKELVSEENAMQIYKNFYKNECFIRIIEEIPETRWVRSSNLCDIGIRVDTRTQRIIVVSAIDNLVKGASGQAVQNMNIIFDLKESEGLNFIPMAP